MKSVLQIRAEKAAKRLDKARKPIVFEFAGVPKAGKTSTLAALQAFLKRCGFKVEIVMERASICPIRDKRHLNFNVWTACTTLANILEKTQNPPRQDDPHVLILDRGLFDALCWLNFMENLERIRPAERATLEAFLTIGDWRNRVSAVFVMTTSPEQAMIREQGLLPVVAEGSIMNTEVLDQMLQSTQETVKRFVNEFRLFPIDTSNSTKDGQRRIAEKVADLALNVIEDHLSEEILCLSVHDVRNLFKGKRFLSAKDAALVTQLFEKGSFHSRLAAEDDGSLVQALPVCVVRNHVGDILTLRRKERSSNNPLVNGG